ncbi:ABC transporter ATP-binding protein [Aurantimonas sp. VKM B-3413]|uniref:ABC transporter ATP-binding protein n=1 Tax=Aurantimonas sp. VKM B-3413 TaxID=2779401 RepID=UPI001E52BEBD|nr:ABC transporter ATP-binding protein [Aurantimonas sp. VKM B-3413]MCB8837007.1 ABC transporter ATP-binding protein [Aurantimonas sp. VKM B-3413]
MLHANSEGLAPGSDVVAVNGGIGIDIIGVDKIFGASGANGFRALSPISLGINAGEFVSVVGPSGCGKSTLMLMVAGLMKPTNGQVKIEGSGLTGPLTEIGIVFQDHLLLDFRTAEANVLLQGEIRKLSMGPVRKRAAELFESLGLQASADKYPNQLSGGMRQRVSLARALVHNPPLLLMDEPFGALDALTRLQVRRDLETLWLQQRPTVLFITHSVEEAVGLSDRVIVMGPSPGGVVEEIPIQLKRPRPLAFGESPELRDYANRIYAHFERLGVLH